MQETKKLTPKIKAAIDVYMENPLINLTDLAKKLGKPYVTVYGWFNSAIVKEEIERRYKEEWNNSSKKAQKKMQKLIDSENPQISFQASRYVLDSCGFAATQNINVNGSMDIEINITNDD